MKDATKITIRDAEVRNERRIMLIAERSKIPLYDRTALISMNKEAYERLANASAIGRAYQDLLLDIYSEEELKAKLNEKVLKVKKEIYL